MVYNTSVMNRVSRIRNVYSSIAYYYYLSSTIMSSAPGSAAAFSNLHRRPSLSGVIFDMDGTLTVPNLDFEEMYRRCKVPIDQDILYVISKMPASEADDARAIVEEMEEEGRRTMQLAPGTLEVIDWMQLHCVPMALVTRNTSKTVDELVRRLSVRTATKNNNRSPFSPTISRDSSTGEDDDLDMKMPVKPHPAGLEYIKRRWGFSQNEPNDGLIMVGDSVSNDVVFGKAAGISTALVNNGETNINSSVDSADVCAPDLLKLPSKIWEHFSLEHISAVGTTLGKYDIPIPTTVASIAAVQNDIQTLQSLTPLELCARDGDANNTPLIWAADAGHEEAVQTILQLLLQQQPTTTTTDTVNVKGYLGATALCRASRRGHVNVIRLLVEIGKADMDIPNDKMQYPLHFAAFKKQANAVKVLLEFGANTMVLDRKGRTPAEDTSDEEIRNVILNAREKTLCGM